MERKIQLSELSFVPMVRNDIGLCLDIIDDAFGRNVEGSGKSFENKHIDEPPWSWFGEENVFFYMLRSNNDLLGYVVWRQRGMVSHLHSFLISSRFQRMGLGKKMLETYHEESLRLKKTIVLFTLHTYEETKYNHLFYEMYGYQQYKKNDELVTKNLNPWIENCRIHNDWPLTNKKLLFYKSV
jgi:ribosomal protein S18 acetylase RimI-like enzyme